MIGDELEEILGGLGSDLKDEDEEGEGGNDAQTRGDNGFDRDDKGPGEECQHDAHGAHDDCDEVGQFARNVELNVELYRRCAGDSIGGEVPRDLAAASVSPHLADDISHAGIVRIKCAVHTRARYTIKVRNEEGRV